MKKILILTALIFTSLFSFEEINETNFEEKTKSGKVIVEFYQPNCAACDELEKNLKGVNLGEDVNFYKINIRKNMNLAPVYNIFATPTLIYFKDGKNQKKSIGAKTAKQVKFTINRYLK